MRDAISGVWVIQIILIFLVIINSYLAFSVNYTKAFRVKNKVISIIENNEGLTDNAKSQIESVMLDTGYNVSSSYISRCGTGSLSGYVPIYNNAGGYCVKVTTTDVNGTAVGSNVYRGSYYGVITFISIDIPILNRIFPIFANVFAIKGDTKTIYSSGFNTETLS